MAKTFRQSLCTDAEFYNHGDHSYYEQNYQRELALAKQDDDILHMQDTEDEDGDLDDDEEDEDEDEGLDEDEDEDDE